MNDNSGNFERALAQQQLVWNSNQGVSYYNHYSFYQINHQSGVDGYLGLAVPQLVAEVSKVEQEPVQILQVMVNSAQEVTLKLEVVDTEETVIVSYMSQATPKNYRYTGTET